MATYVSKITSTDLIENPEWGAKLGSYYIHSSGRGIIWAEKLAELLPAIERLLGDGAIENVEISITREAV